MADKHCRMQAKAAGCAASDLLSLPQKAKVKLRCETLSFTKVKPDEFYTKSQACFALRAEIQTYDAYENMGNPFDVGF